MKPLPLEGCPVEDAPTPERGSDQNPERGSDQKTPTVGIEALIDVLGKVAVLEFALGIKSLPEDELYQRLEGLYHRGFREGFIAAGAPVEGCPVEDAPTPERGSDQNPERGRIKKPRPWVLRR